MSAGRSLADVLGRRAAVQAVPSSIAGPSRQRFSTHALAAPRFHPTLTLLRSSTCRRPLPPSSGTNVRQKRRGIATEATSAAASASIFDPLVSALLASPLPSYGLTIIALTLAVRTCVTLPATLWQRKRLERSRELVVPEMKRINAVLAPQMARESRKQGLDYEAYKKALKAKLAEHQSALHRKHKTHPLPTMVLPLAVHIPLLITLSLVIRRAVDLPGSPLAHESFLWLQQLGDSDSTGALPILGGLMAFANAELAGRRARKAEEPEEVVEGVEGSPQQPLESQNGLQRPLVPTAPPVQPSTPVGTPSRPRAIDLTAALKRAPKPQQRSASTVPPRISRIKSTPPPSSSTPPQLESLGPGPNGKIPEKDKAELRTMVLTGALRFGAVLFVPIAANVPSALALYWCTSLGYTLAQGAVLNALEKPGAPSPAPSTPKAG